MLDEFADLIEIKKSEYGHTKYTIAIPTYMRPETLANTVKSALAQKYDGNYKVIIVDNNPERNDDTEILIRTLTESCVSYFKNSKNTGMVNNWNQCIIAADCDWVVLVHDDDLLTEECLEIIEESLNNNPNVDAVLPNYIQKNNPFTKHVEDKASPHMRNLLKSCVRMIIKKDRPIEANLFCDNIYGPPTCGLALRRDAVIEYGGYPDRCIAADWDFMSHFSRNHKITKSEKQTGIYLWAENASLQESTMEQIRKDRITIIKDIVDYSAISRFYYKLLRNDFEKKFRAKTTEHVDYSPLYNIFKKYYSLRV